ncbi:hypothetical protein [Arthrobacter glacialis]|uniref:Lipoprotein n=1 Tax=Arthrobacter glacialis TaxID=1664 RepID=A0A2S4A0V6_ARTGL|nr:hypothetical protein [Arthrobacter glacialis]POH61042.1 hypothetical protein CVS28_00590 [Arthrobacter glacialis]POH75141.1 hypothetical protein CVS27_00565 [Arthrobacter glacialis]
MNSKAIAAVVLAATMSGALGMSGCGSPPVPPTQTPSPAASDADTDALLALNEKLRSQLGDSYSDSWIEANKLHVAVTNQAAADLVTAAGAVATIVTVDAAALEAALQAVATWRATLPAEQGAAIHSIIPDGRTGTLTISVAIEQLEAVTKAVAEDNPAGAIAVIVKESSGLPTPL